MSLCVPERDRSGGMLDSVIPSKGFHGLLVNGKVDFVRSRKSHYSEVPDQDTLEVGWPENGHLDMQGQSSKCSKSQWQYTGWNSGQDGEDGVTPSKPTISKSHGSLEDVVNDTTSEAHHAAHNLDVDDEMVSWLQYPLDATLERSYYSEFFEEPPESNTQLLKESFVATRTMRPPHTGSPGYDAASVRAATADEAMKLGAGRAAGILPQAGVEAFTKVRTLQPPSTITRWPQPVNGANMVVNASLVGTKTSPSGSTSNPMLPPKTQPAASHQSPPSNRPGSMNFSHFSRPAQMVKANLHSLAGSLHPVAPPPPSARYKQQPGRPTVEACNSSCSSIAESASAGQEVKVQMGVMERDQSNGMEDSRWQAAPPPVPTKDMSSGGGCKSASPVDMETCRSQVSLATSSGKAMSLVTQHPDNPEPTITSSSGGYGTSDRPKETSANTKRKSSEREDTECQSEDGEDESVDLKKPVAGRGSTTKRSRAAEVHNQSERRRRDRINEKMRALQELIPNSNKTDKASMLDEAIEYLKMLQVQLQMMSMRTGMTLPPMVVPSGMQQHMQMPQMAGMPSMGMVQMGLGMGMMDMGVSAPGRTVMPMQSHGGPSLNGNMASPSSLVDMHDYRYQAPGAVMDSYNAYVARQHQPMQMNPALGIDKYNAYMLQQHQIQLHQQQQQQQLQQQQQQQQHQQHPQLQPHQQHQLHQQQHQHHQQAPSMNGGPPH